MKKALVIGSEGNVGKPLVKYLRSKGYEVLCTDIKPAWRKDYIMADISNTIDVLPAFDWQPDVVYIMSAMVSRVTCEQAAGLTMQTNLVGLNNILQLCKRVNAMTVFFSTSEVYGPDLAVMDEDISDPQPNNRYGLSKLLGEQLVRYEAKYHNLKAVILRPFMIYDEFEDLGDHRSAMIRFATNLSSNKPITVHEGSARGWLHISDAVRAIEASSKINELKTINIGNPDIRPISELAEMIRAELNADRALIQVSTIPTQMTQVKDPKLDRMQNELGIVPEISLEMGVKRVCSEIQIRLESQSIYAAKCDSQV